MTSRSSVFRRLAGALAPARRDIVWQPEGQCYPRLLTFDGQELTGRSGLYAVWHLGVRPQWLRVGFATDLAAAISVLAKTPEIAAFAPHDGPFVSWCFGTAAEASGRVRYLAERLLPVAQGLLLRCDVVVDPSRAATPCALPAGTTDIPPGPRG